MPANEKKLVESNESLDNPFRPEGQLAKEADEFVKQLKIREEQKVQEIIQTSLNNSINTNAANSPSKSINLSGVNVTVVNNTKSSNVAASSPPPTQKSSSQQQQQAAAATSSPTKTTTNKPAAATQQDNSSNKKDDKKKKKSSDGDGKTKPKCGCTIS